MEQAGQFRLPEPHVPSRILLDSATSEAGQREVRDNVSVEAHSAMLLFAEFV
jgi:hypothetical protein